MKRLISAAAVLSFGTVAFLALAVPRLYTGYEERAVWVDLQEVTEGDVLTERAVAALADGDVEGAEAYRDLGVELQKPIAPGAEAAIIEAQGTFATIMRNTADFAGAYITGHADSAAGLAGAVASDLTVVGDVRDIISEGGKAAAGEEYSQFLLALAAIGLAAEGATIATGGTSLVFQAGVSMLKVAKRTGNLTVDFTNYLVGLTRAAARRTPDAPVPGPQAAGAATTAAATGARLTRGAARAELRQVLGALNTTAQNAGAANTVRLMRTVRTGADARRLADFSGRFGTRTRIVAELTGKTALRGFRVAVRGARMLLMLIYSFLAWLAGLIALRLVRALFTGLVNLFRGAVLSVVTP